MADITIIIEGDPDNSDNLLLICTQCPGIVMPVRSGITVNRVIELISIHIIRDHNKSEEN